MVFLVFPGFQSLRGTPLGFPGLGVLAGFPEFPGLQDGFQGSRKGSRVFWVPGNFTVSSTSSVPIFPQFRVIFQDSRAPWVPGNFTVPSNCRVPAFPGFREILQFPVPQGSRVPWVPGNFKVSSGACWQENKVLGVVDFKENRINSKLRNSCNSNSCNSKHKERLD